MLIKLFGLNYLINVTVRYSIRPRYSEKTTEMPKSAMN